MKKKERFFVAGHTGLIGSAVLRRLQKKGYDNILTISHADLDLTDTRAVNDFFDEHKPEYVVLAAGKVGGIIENQSYPADFMNTNLAIQLNVLQAAHKTGVRKLIYFASSCMYPRECPQPMAETALLSGYPESTSLAYAVSKLAGMQMCLSYNRQYGEQRFIPVIPNSAYGANDNFDPKSGHVLSSLIRRFHEARKTGIQKVTLWGSGTPRREFIHSDDIASACISLLVKDTEDLELPLNLGTGEDYSIRELAEIIAQVVGYTGDIYWDKTKPDGAPQKLLDSSRLHTFGWKPVIDFEEGVRDTYRWYVDNTLSEEL